MSGKIKDIDRGYKNFFKRALSAALSHEVTTVGVQGEAATKDHGGIDNVRLAGVHEFGAEIKTGTGTIKIPERSFIRSTVDKHNAYKEEAKHLAGKVLAGELTATKALRVLGEKISSDIKRTIEQGIPPPNAPSTIAAKGSSHPLIDSGQMKNSITYEVRTDDGSEGIT